MKSKTTMSISASIRLALFVSTMLILTGLAGCNSNRQAGDTLSREQLLAWHQEKAAGGATFGGSPAWVAHVEMIERGLRERGVVDVSRESFEYQRWSVSDDPDDREWTLSIAGNDIPVASYWAYSGATPADGVTAPMIYYQKGLSAEALKDNIVVFDVGNVPDGMMAAFKAGNEFATYEPTPGDGVASDQWYQGNYVTRFGRYDELLKKSGAAGAIIIYDMSPGRAAGLYTFPLLNVGIFGVPSIYVDRVSGAAVREAAKSGEQATVTLLAKTEPTETWFLTGYLPGKNYGSAEDELVLLVTHSDGPNLLQENGAFGILGVIDHFSRVPQAERNRTLLVLLDPQHYMPGRHVFDWYDDHPEIVERIVASIGVEQLGQLEYSENGNEFGLNGQVEPTLFFVQENKRLVEIAIAAVTANEVPRAEVRVPSRGDQGMWAGLGDVAIKQNIPGFAISSGMSGYWTTTPGIEAFDADLCYRQIGVLVAMTGALMDSDLDEIGVVSVDPDMNPAMSPGTNR